MKKRIPFILVAVCLILSLFPLTSLADNEGILSVSAITAPGPFGQKLEAVIVEYGDTVDLAALDTESFELRAEKNNLTGEYATSTITRVYTNSVPELLASGSVEGKYVIIETDTYDKVGLVVDNYYYMDGTTTKSMAVRKDMNGSYNISVMQLDSVMSESGAVLAEPTAAPVAISQDAIEHTVIEDFDYTYLTDAQADEVLGKFTFENNNFEYSISSNSTKTNNKNLTEEDLLGDLNFATLAGLGVNVWVHLPDNYDPSKKYPLFFYGHGTGETITDVTLADSTLVTNRGIHFAVNLAACTWATSEDLGYEDVIVVAPQYYSGNSPRADGYERDDAFRAAFCYVLDTYAVDRDRVFVSGTSQGAGRTTALLRDCAEYITGVIIQNGGYSSALARETDGVEIHEEIFEFAASKGVSAWWFQGINDFISPPYVAESMYNALVNLYTEQGKSPEWIEDNVRITYFPMKLYTDMYETSAHSTIKPTYEWYAVYDNDRYYDKYSDGSLGDNLDLKYGNNDPGGYKGMMDWVLSRNCADTRAGSDVGAVVDPTFIITIPTSVNFGSLIKNTGIQEMPFVVTMTDSVLGMGAHVDVNVFSTFLMSAGSATLGYDLFNETGTQQSNGSTYTSFTADGSDTGKVTVDTAEITQAGAYNGTMLFNFTYVG